MLDDGLLWNNEVFHPSEAKCSNLTNVFRLLLKAARNVYRHIQSNIRNKSRRSNLKKRAISRADIPADFPQVVRDLQDKRELESSDKTRVFTGRGKSRHHYFNSNNKHPHCLEAHGTR